MKDKDNMIEEITKIGIEKVVGDHHRTLLVTHITEEEGIDENN